jgi:predicted TIM-barrel fold metal-dependent hydrolase
MSVEPSLIDTPEWDDEYERIMQMAEELGVEEAVRGLVVL